MARIARILVVQNRSEHNGAYQMKVLISMCLLLSMFSFVSDANERIIKNIEFATIDKHRLALDLYLPEGVKKPPLVIWVHG